MKNKIILSILICTMIVGSLSGCGKGTSDNSPEADDGKVKLTALIQRGGSGKTVDEMEWLKELEEKTGVEIEWQQITADWDQKKSAMFASGEIPDLLFGTTVDADYVQYNGLFEDMSSLIETEAPNIQQMFTDHPETKELASTEDGKIYGLSSYQALWPKVSSSMFINKTWLDNLGLEIPTTWDELKEVLIAFRDGDPNGNGDTTDEIPMTFTSDFVSRSGGADILCLLGGTGMQLTDRAPYGYFAEDATVKNCFVDERFKDYIKFLRELYQEGCISKDALTQDYSKYQSVCRADGVVAQVGLTFGWETADRFGNELKDEYITIPQIRQDESVEKPAYPYEFYVLNYHKNLVAMSSKCENKEAAMRFIDGFYDKEVSLEVLFGGMNDVDKGVKKNDDGTYEVLPPADESMDPGTWKWQTTIADVGPFYIRDEMRDKLTLGVDMIRAVDEKKVYDKDLENVDPKTNLYPQSFMKYSTEDINTMAMNQANIDNIVDQTAAAWMTDPSRDIDAEWDNYVKSVYDAGLTQNLEIRQKSYLKYLSSLE